MTTSAQENETLLRQKDFLLKEVNHRVQNSLSTVAALLRIQSRETSEEAKNELLKAERRLMAVSLAHRRLYQDESVQIIDFSRYLSELVRDLFDTMGEQWSDNLRLELSPVMAPTNRAVALGLVLNELVTNLSKYAYEGRSGPVQIVLTQNRDTIQLLISDVLRSRVERDCCWNWVRAQNASGAPVHTRRKPTL